MVKYSANTWNVEEPKNNFTHLQNLHISARLEEKLHIGCLRPPGKCNHMQNQKEEKERKTAHGFLRKCQPPACPGNPVATTDRSGRTQCQAEKTGIVEQVTRWQDSRTGSLILWVSTTHVISLLSVPRVLFNSCLDFSIQHLHHNGTLFETQSSRSGMTARVVEKIGWTFRGLSTCKIAAVIAQDANGTHADNHNLFHPSLSPHHHSTPILIQ